MPTCKSECQELGPRTQILSQKTRAKNEALAWAKMVAAKQARFLVVYRAGSLLVAKGCG